MKTNRYTIITGIIVSAIFSIQCSSPEKEVKLTDSKGELYAKVPDLKQTEKFQPVSGLQDLKKPKATITGIADISQQVLHKARESEMVLLLMNERPVSKANIKSKIIRVNKNTIELESGYNLVLNLPEIHDDLGYLANKNISLDYIEAGFRNAAYRSVKISFDTQPLVYVLNYANGRPVIKELGYFKIEQTKIKIKRLENASEIIYELVCNIVVDKDNRVQLRKNSTTKIEFRNNYYDVTLLDSYFLEEKDTGDSNEGDCYCVNLIISLVN